MTRKTARRSAEQHSFELTGGNVSLDLANTVDRRASDEPEDHLTAYGDLLRFAEQTGMVSRERLRRLRSAAAKHPLAAARAFRRAVELRSLIFRVFSTTEPAPAVLAELTKWSREAAAHRILARDGSDVVWQWDDEELDSVLWPIVDAAVSLMTSPERARVRTCSGVTCRWLFIDQSRQGNRRWCDMSVCGNRAKARRHYERAKGSKVLDA